MTEAQTVSQAVAAKQAGPVTIMWQRRNHFDAVLPQHVDIEAFLGTAAGALYGNKDLMEAAQTSPDSLITALMRCAALGHQPGSDEFYLVPRKRKGRPEVQGIEGYRGIVERMYRSGAVSSVVVREVCTGDRFSYVEGVDDKPVHEIGGEGITGADFFGEHGDRSRGEMVGVYAYAKLKDGAVSRVVILSRDDVMASREASDSKNSQFSPWNRMDGGATRSEFKGRSMWWKTAARRLEPWVPTSAEFRREQLRASVTADNLRRDALPAQARQAIEQGEPVDAEVVDPDAEAAAEAGVSPLPYDGAEPTEGGA